MSSRVGGDLPNTVRKQKVSHDHDGWGEELSRGGGQEPKGIKAQQHGKGIEGIRGIFIFSHLTKDFLFLKKLQFLDATNGVNNRGKQRLQSEKIGIKSQTEQKLE